MQTIFISRQLQKHYSIKKKKKHVPGRKVIKARPKPGCPATNYYHSEVIYSAQLTQHHL
jgi:hypothetical protein